MKGIYIWHLIILVSIVSLAKAFPPECFTSLVESQSCLWYTYCLEDKFHCGTSGYPVQYGFKYCNKFGQMKTFPQAKLWIEKTTTCLKRSLTFTLKDDITFTCHQLRNKAFETHPHCYEQAGFCKLFKQLGFEDSAIFLKQLLGIFDARDFQSISAMKQVEDMALECLKIIKLDQVTK